MKRLILLGLLVFSLLAGCDSKPEKIDVGFVGSLSGRYSDLGQNTLQGVMLAVEYSGISDRVNLVVKDDSGVPADGVKALEEFEAEGVKYVIGPSLSNVATTVVPLLSAKNIFMVSPTTSTSTLAGLKDNFMRTMPHNNYHQAVVISKYLRDKLNIKRVVVIFDSRNASYSNDIVMKFTEAFMKKGGEVMDVRPFNPDNGASLNNLVSSDVGNPPDLYYVIGSSMDTSLIIWQIRKNGMVSDVLIRRWAAAGDFFRLGGDAVEGVKLFSYHIDKKMPAYIEFTDRYKEKFHKEPSWMAVYGYETARTLLQSIGNLQSGKNFYESMNKAVKSNKLLVDFKYDEFGDAFLPLHYFEVEGGEIIYKGKAE